MKKTPFDYLDLHCNKFYEMKMMVVRFLISKDSYECIITNLPQDKINSDQIKQLYAKQWGIETSFRELYSCNANLLSFSITKKEEAPPDVEYLIGHELLPIRSERTDPRKGKLQSAISFLYRAA